MPTAATDAREPSMAYRLRARDLVAEFGTNEQHGLSDEEARSRIAQYGSNELAAEKPVPAWRRFLAQFRDVLVILLLVATAISAALWLVERDAALPYEAIAIFAVVLLNATMGFAQESRAEAAVDGVAHRNRCAQEKESDHQAEAPSPKQIAQPPSSVYRALLEVLMN